MRTALRFASAIAAFLAAADWLLTWMVGGYFSYGGLAMDASYFFDGIGTTILGVLTAPIVAAITSSSTWATGKRRGLLAIVGIAGIAALLATGPLLVLGSTGALGERAPAGVRWAWSAAIGLFFLWTLLLCVLARGRLGTAALIGMACGVLLVLWGGGAAVLQLFYPDWAVISPSAALVLPLYALFFLWFFATPAWLVGLGFALLHTGDVGDTAVRSGGGPLRLT